MHGNDTYCSLTSLLDILFYEGTKRTWQCVECGCKATDWGNWEYCQDMKKFGVPGKKKNCSVPPNMSRSR